MHLLLAPLEMKGILTAVEIAELMDRTLASVWPQATRESLPLADGGPGTLSALRRALPQLRRVPARVSDPLGRPVEAHFGFLEADVPTAFIESAEACGLWRLTEREREVGRSSTFGVGELILRALESPARRIVIGMGGSATNDGGAGALQALGVRLLDASDEELPRGGASLVRARRLELGGLSARLPDVEWVLAADVRAPLLGAGGATRVFATQKGASPQELADLEAGLENFASLLEVATGHTCRELPGSGASGGLAFGLSALTGAEPRAGLDVLAEVIGLDARLQRADLVLTAEGALDAQSLLGKGPVRLAERARALGRSTVAFVGRAATEAPMFQEVIEAQVPGAFSARTAREALERELVRWASGRASQA